MSKSYTSSMRIRAAGVVAVLALAGGTLSACGSNSASADTGHTATAPSAKAVVSLNNALSALWADHMHYTFDTVNAFFHNPAELQPSLDRLLRNQKDLGAAIVPFYGKAAGDKLTALLTSHIQLAVPVLTAAKKGDNAALTKAVAAWQANAKEIADFLSSANPSNWPTSATEPMMSEHITQTIAYAVDLLKGNYAQAIVDYDKASAHMMSMANVLATGIAAQFPAKVG